jgi:simple sugar transport system ATP-binding protein
MLGHEQTRAGGLIDLPAARQRVREISDRFGFDVDPDALVDDLPVGVQQRVEIIKALSRDARVLVFDEPTAVLTPQETDELMGIMRQLKESGASIVFITHKLREVREVADRITVVRLGKVVGEAAPTASNAELASLMVGRAVELTVQKEEPTLGEEALQVEHLTVIDQVGQLVVNDVSFTVRRGEVLAVAGVQGNGQTELTEALVGLQPRVQGTIRLDGAEITRHSVRRILDAGVGFVPEDRTEDGLVGEFTVAENLMLDRAEGEPFVKAGNVQRGFLAEFAREKVEEFDVRTPGIETKAGRLSGGNQQKVVLARWLLRHCRVLLLDEPTRGVDVPTKAEIYRPITDLARAGLGVLVVSSEMEELVGICTRILVMRLGEIVAEVDGATATQQELRRHPVAPGDVPVRGEGIE